MKTQKEKWDEYLQAIIDALGADGIQKKCEEWGLEFTGTESGSGWAECRAKNRSDENASAAVNLGTGYYRDLGPGPSSRFSASALSTDHSHTSTNVLTHWAKR